MIRKNISFYCFYTLRPRPIEAVSIGERKFGGILAMQSKTCWILQDSHGMSSMECTKMGQRRCRII